MESKNLLTLAITLTVGIILAGSLLMPVISDATTTERTFTNNGYFRMSETLSTDENTVITWDSANAFVFNLNGNDIELPPGATSGTVYPYTILASDAWALRAAVLNDTVNVDLTLYGSGSDSTLLWFVNSWSNDTATITLSAGTASFKANDSTPVTVSYTHAFIPDENGNYILKKGTETAYLHGESLIYATGRTTATFGEDSVDLNINIEGNITDGETVTVLAPTGYTSDNIEVVNSQVTGYKDLYTFDKVTFEITETDSSTTVDVVYSQVIVPYQITAELSQHLDPAEIAIMNALPVLIIVALVVMATGALYLKRDD